MLTGENIICISSIDWDFNWQGHQEIMAAFAGQGNRVLFIENTGIRSAHFSDVARLKKRLLNWWKSTRGFRQERANLFIYSPLILPFPYSRIMRAMNRFIMNWDLKRWMKIMRFDSPIVWTFLPTPLVADTIENLNSKLVIYYCIDKFGAGSRLAQKIRRSEIKMLKKVDLVFVTSHQLYNYAMQYNANTHLFPFAVNIETFDRIRENKKSEAPKELESIPHPRIGYVGGIHRWIDLDLLYQLAGLCPNFQFVLVGPIQVHADQIKKMPNIHWLGAKAHPSVPSYIGAFDVCLIPYRLTEYTDNVYPTKLNEYLAMGKPVVSTPLREVKLFNEQHGSFVRIASDARNFGESIKEILSQKDHQEALRIAVARENSWGLRIEKMCHLISQKLPEGAVSMERHWQRRMLSLYRQTKRRIFKVATVCVALYLLIFYSPLVWWMAKPLMIAQTPYLADAIVVYGGGVGASGKPGQDHEWRVKKALELYQGGYARVLIFSSGYVYAFNEPQVMKGIAVQNGVPSQNIYLEEKASNTYENVVRVLDILRKNNWHSILLVSTPYHMERVSLTFKKNAPDIRVAYTPINVILYDHPFNPNLEQIEAIVHEYAAIVYYWWRGWL